MTNEEPLDKPAVKTETEYKLERPLVITIICIVGLIINLLEIIALFNLSQINPLGENRWTICLKIIPAINVLCWIGFWTMRKATLILYTLNLFFLVWVHFHIAGFSAFFDFYTFVYFLIGVIMLGQLHKMDEFV
jgi:hypothetical protein